MSHLFDSIDHKNYRRTKDKINNNEQFGICIYSPSTIAVSGTRRTIVAVRR
jgi:hypothetical protein